MTRMAKFSAVLLGAGAMALATLSLAAAASTTVSGTLVDAAKWVSGDSNTVALNMPAVMMSNMMPNMTKSGGMMSNMNSNSGVMMSGPNSGSGSAHHASGGLMPGQGSSTGMGMGMGMSMSGGMMGCHATLGVVTSSGELYVLLANQSSPMGALSLCSRVGQRVTVTGTTFSRGGMHALRVDKLPQ